MTTLDGRKATQDELGPALLRQYINFFLQSDANEDKELSFDEFVEAMPARVSAAHPKAKLRAWFNLADKNGDGVISKEEFIQWSLAMASAVTGGDLRKVLESEGEELDSLAFTHRARKLGFGEDALEIFAQLPQLSDGSLDFRQLAHTVRMPNSAASHTMREFMLAMSWNTADDKEDDVIDTSGWSFQGVGPESTRVALKALIDEHGVKLSQLFTTLDTSDDHTLSEAELIAGFNTLGFQGDPAIIHDIFVTLDDDGVPPKPPYSSARPYASLHSCLSTWDSHIT